MSNFARRYSITRISVIIVALTMLLSASVFSSELPTNALELQRLKAEVDKEHRNIQASNSAMRKQVVDLRLKINELLQAQEELDRQISDGLKEIDAYPQ